jgi:hypothetical protein
VCEWAGYELKIPSFSEDNLFDLSKLVKTRAEQSRLWIKKS